MEQTTTRDYDKEDYDRQSDEKSEVLSDFMSAYGEQVRKDFMAYGDRQARFDEWKKQYPDETDEELLNDFLDCEKGWYDFIEGEYSDMCMDIQQDGDYSGR
jgi:hypothetical protein